MYPRHHVLHTHTRSAIYYPNGGEGAAGGTSYTILVTLCVVDAKLSRVHKDKGEMRVHTPMRRGRKAQSGNDREPLQTHKSRQNHHTLSHGLISSTTFLQHSTTLYSLQLYSISTVYNLYNHSSRAIATNALFFFPLYTPQLTRAVCP